VRLKNSCAVCLLSAAGLEMRATNKNGGPEWAAEMWVAVIILPPLATSAGYKLFLVESCRLSQIALVGN
jgi:hypothetical protein